MSGEAYPCVECSRPLGGLLLDPNCKLWRPPIPHDDGSVTFGFTCPFCGYGYAFTLSAAEMAEGRARRAREEYEAFHGPTPPASRAVN